MDPLPSNLTAQSNWRRKGLFWTTLVNLLVIVAAFTAARYFLVLNLTQLHGQLGVLTKDVERLRQEEAGPAVALNRYRSSICYIVGIYDFRYAHQRATKRTRVSGTGFVVADGLIATNRHVVEPWYGEFDSNGVPRDGMNASYESLVAYFPGVHDPVSLSPAVISGDVDLAVVRMKTQAGYQWQAVPLSMDQPNPGEIVAVIGYPMGVLGMMVKAPAAVYARLASGHDLQGSAQELAALSLIRPSTTFGHLGDVVGSTLIYDAPTTHGASGGPVFNDRGEVIGVNTAYLDGFSGESLGVSSQALKSMIEEARSKKP